MMSTNWHRACAVALLGMLPTLAGAAPEYFSTTPAGSKYARAGSLNDLGRYAINSFGPESPVQGAAIHGGGGMPENVGSLGGSFTQVWALNNPGQAVGLSTTGTGEEHAFLYADGRTQDLTARYDIYDPRDINDRGDISARTADFRAAILKDGAVDDFGPQNSMPIAMNGRGELLVEYAPAGAGIRTAVYSDGTLTDLPLAGGMRYYGQAINDAGWVTGYFTNADGRDHAFLWDGGTFFNLTPGARSAIGYDINDLGQVVGVADNRAFLYADGELIDLNTRIDPEADLLLVSGDEINDRTQILAFSCDRAGVFCYNSMLLDPVPAVPEPSAIMMLLAGLGLAAAHCKRVPMRLR